MKAKIIPLDSVRSAERDCLLIGVARDGSGKSGGVVSPALKKAAAAAEFDLGALSKADLPAAGRTATLFGGNGRRAVLAGMGSAPASPRDCAAALAAGFAAAGKLKAKRVLCLLDAGVVDGRDEDWVLMRAASLAAAATYKFKPGAQPGATGPKEVLFAGGPTDKLRAAVGRGLAEGAGVNLTRHLAEQPPNICDPAFLVAAARRLAGRPGWSVDVLDRKRMAALKMGALLGVAQGSAKEPYLVEMRYRGAKSGAPVVLVGKGVTFDTGGISLKPGAGMDEMKFDMCGAATVFGAMLAASEMKLPLDLVGIVPAVENMPSGRALRPSDILESSSGKTIEVLNTDAEGRLILADALTYAKRHKPAMIVDMATLTGACVIALGHHASGLMGNDAALVRRLLEAGERAADPAWELPLWKEYDEQLKSDYADMANIGGRDAGTITAGCFLGRFAKKSSWAHLDIAGTAWTKKKRATGRPVPLLCEFLRGCASS